MRAIKQLLVIGVFGLLIVGAVSVSGFYNPARKKLIGKWDISFEMTQTDLRQMGVTNNPLVAATAQSIMKSMQAEMEVEFRDDDTVTLGVTTFGLFAGETGTWRVDGRDGDRVVLELQLEQDRLLGSGPSRSSMTTRSKWTHPRNRVSRPVNLSFFGARRPALNRSD